MVTFYDNFIPSLKDGEYTIKVSQSLVVNTGQTNIDGGNPDVTTPPQADLSQKFIVRGSRFTLNPTDIHRAFPPNNTTGLYDEYLPMVVFNKRSLPWERELDLSPSQIQGLPSGLQDPGLYPWVALLVFSGDELIIPQPASGPAPDPPQGSQTNPTRSASFALNNVVNSTFDGTQTAGPPPGILGPTIGLEDDEDPNTIFCNVIDIAADTFAQLIPTLNDLRFLAHVRQVSTVNKEPLANTPHDGWFSTAIANRFCVPPPTANGTAGQRNIAHLVSLEGLEPFLGVGTPLPVSGFQKVRLISLYSWTFTCLHDPVENFRQVMLNLISTQSEMGTDLLLRMPLPESALPAQPGIPSYVATKLQNGYAPLSYATRTGEQTFAWYRGPLAPVIAPTFLDTIDPAQPDDPAAPLNVSEAMVYDPATGLFEQSYAVGFQTGRSLALANQVFATNLLQWRRSAHGAVDLLMEYMSSPNWNGILKQNNVLGANRTLVNIGVGDLAELLNTNIVSRAFKNFLATDFYDSVAKHVGKTGGFDPSDANTLLTSVVEQPPVVPADLAQLMQQPVVVSLLQHLSGIETLGSTASVLSGTVTSIPLQSPGVTEALSVGNSVAIVSPDGKTTVIVAVASAAALGDPQIQILPFSFLNAMPSGSSVQLSASPILPEQVITWLANIALLNDVPFNNLVPNVSMLQQECIRFFYIDQNWINALIDGALSIGIQSSRDSLFQQLMNNKLHAAVDDALTEVRDTLRGVSSSGVPTQEGTRAGFILRSVVVSSIPGLEIRAWSATDSVNPMKMLRLDRLAPNIMIAIFPDIPVKLEFNEPSEGLVFGYEDEGVALRYLPGTTGATLANIGSVIDPDNPTWLAPAEINKLKRSLPANQPPLIIAGSNGLMQALQNKFAAPQPELTPASLAVEMVRVPEQMLFLPVSADAEADVSTVARIPKK